MCVDSTQILLKRNVTLQVEWNFHPNLCVIGDPYRLNQCLLNFLSNAAKFTEEGTIKLNCKEVRVCPQISRLEFEIRDTGIGISPDTLKHLMQPFVQGDSSTTRKYGGTGLGLVISKQIIKFMNGDIKVQSELGKGTTVSWWVTLRRVDSKDNHSITEVLKFKRNLDILVVEDNSVNRKLFSTLITSLNISCDCAENGFDALTACQKKNTI